MSRFISFAARQAETGQFPAEIEAALLRIHHPDLPGDGYLYICSHGPELVDVDALVWGIRSTFTATSGRKDYLAVAMGVEVPGEDEDGVSEGGLVFEPADARIAEALTATIHPAIVDIAVVMAATPDVTEFEAHGLELTAAECDGGLISLRFSQDQLLEEACPIDRTTRQRFPGLHA